MTELCFFSEKLSACDFIALTPLSEDHLYCRFYADGLYMDRMFVTEPNLLQELLSLNTDGEVIKDKGILQLKQKYGDIHQLQLSHQLVESKAV